MKLLRDLLIAIAIMSLWIGLAWWQTNNTSAQAAEMSMYHATPPTCQLLTNSYFDYDFSKQPPQLAGWYQRQYVACPVTGGTVVIE